MQWSKWRKKTFLVAHIQEAHCKQKVVCIWGDLSQMSNIKVCREGDFELQRSEGEQSGGKCSRKRKMRGLGLIAEIMQSCWRIVAWRQLVEVRLCSLKGNTRAIGCADLWELEWWLTGIRTWTTLKLHFFNVFPRGSEDTALLFLKEIYRTMNINPEQPQHWRADTRICKSLLM